MIDVGELVVVVYVEVVEELEVVVNVEVVVDVDAVVWVFAIGLPSWIGFGYTNLFVWIWISPI